MAMIEKLLNPAEFGSIKPNSGVAGVVWRRQISSAFTTSWATRGQRLGRGGFGDANRKYLGGLETGCGSPEAGPHK
jgi:hypothetical protein